MTTTPKDNTGGGNNSTITTGNLTKVVGAAIGPNAQAFVSYGLSVEEVAALLVQLKNKDQPIVWNGEVPYLGQRTAQPCAGFR